MLWKTAGGSIAQSLVPAGGGSLGLFGVWLVLDCASRAAAGGCEGWSREAGGVPGELRCECRQLRSECPSPSPPPLPALGCRSWGATDAGEERRGEVRFPRAVQAAGTRLHAWRTEPACSASRAKWEGWDSQEWLPRHMQNYSGQTPLSPGTVLLLAPEGVRELEINSSSWELSPHFELECRLSSQSPHR